MKVMNNDRERLAGYAWPGGYPVMYLARDGWRDGDEGVLDLNEFDRSLNTSCAKCAADVKRWPDMIVVGEYVHYEGPPEICEYCNGETESAYGDPAKEEEANHGA